MPVLGIWGDIPLSQKGDKMIRVDDLVFTPRFCTVRITRIFNSRCEAIREGFSEPTHYHKDGYGILGKSLDLYHMEFAAVKEK